MEALTSSWFESRPERNDEPWQETEVAQQNPDDDALRNAA